MIISSESTELRVLRPSSMARNVAVLNLNLESIVEIVFANLKREEGREAIMYVESI